MIPLDGARRTRPVAKVCGLTSAADVQLAVGAGADWLGFVSCPRSPRHLDDGAAVRLGRDARRFDASALTVLVTADRGPDDVLGLSADGAFDAVQLCGDEDPGEWSVASEGAPALLRRIACPAGDDLESALHEVERWRGVAAAFVIDDPGSAGGSGRRVDLAGALGLAREARALGAPCLLAGGLDGEAVAGLAPERAAPFLGFDASSRLESSPRTKCAARVAAFVRSVHALPAPLR